MRVFSRASFVVASLGAALVALPDCSSDGTTATSTNDAGDGAATDGAPADSAPADSASSDAAAEAEAEAGLTVTILTPTKDQTFATTDPIPLSGQAIDPVEGVIVDPARTLWFGGLKGGGVNPEGESPQDTIPASTLEAGVYTIRFVATTLQDASAAAEVQINVQ